MKCVKVWTANLPLSFPLPHQPDCTISVSQQVSTNQKQVGKMSLFDHCYHDIRAETDTFTSHLRKFSDRPFVSDEDEQASVSGQAGTCKRLRGGWTLW